MLDPLDEELDEPDGADDPDELDEEELDPSDDELLEDPEEDESDDDSALPAFTVLVVDVLRESVR